MDLQKNISTIVVAGFLVFCVFMTGCVSHLEETEIPSMPPVPAEGAFIFSDDDNNAIVTVPAGSEIAIFLDENPTTGYSWNVTSTEGLQYIDDAFVPPETQLVGAGGVHVWRYLVTEPGSAGFSAISMQPWMDVTGEETTYSIQFTVE